MKQITIKQIYKFTKKIYKKTMNDQYRNSSSQTINNGFQKTDYLNYDFIDKLEYDDNTKKLILVIKNYEKKPKITKYVQNNYVKTPIYGDYSIKTKNIKSISKRININKFLEEELLKYEFIKQINDDIIDYFDYIPSWKQKEMDITSLKSKIENMESIRNKNNDKINDFKKDILLVNKNYEKQVEINKNNQNLRTIPDSNLKRIIFICLSFSILGLISWIFYFSETKAENNKIIQKNSAQDLEKSIKNRDITILEKNKKIVEYEKMVEENLININLKQTDLLSIKLKDYKSNSLRNDENEDFLNLRSSFNHNWDNEIKGIYIFWNKTKNKYYVGQSKNVIKRVMNQHFNKGEVKNIIFAKDWFNDDDFYWKYIECETKDEMDQLEKNYIEEYNSFAKGYNSNSGNT